MSESISARIPDCRNLRFARHSGRARFRLGARRNGPDDKFDLVIKGGDVLDPSQIAARQARHRHPLRRDRGGGGRHSGRRARCACSTPSGKLVTPGLDRPARPRLSLRLGDRHSRRRAGAVPVHHHLRFGGRRRRQQLRRLPPLHRRRRRARGSTPSCTSPTSGCAGFPVAELYNIDFAQVDAAAKAVAENADIVLGVKVRMSENVIAKHGLEPLKRAIQACEMAGDRRQGHVPHRRRRDAAS